jgi:hypothetical protein
MPSCGEPKTAVVEVNDTPFVPEMTPKAVPPEKSSNKKVVADAGAEDPSVSSTEAARVQMNRMASLPRVAP